MNHLNTTNTFISLFQKMFFNCVYTRIRCNFRHVLRAIELDRYDTGLMESIPLPNHHTQTNRILKNSSDDVRCWCLDSWIPPETCFLYRDFKISFFKYLYPQVYLRKNLLNRKPSFIVFHPIDFEPRRWTSEIHFFSGKYCLFFFFQMDICITLVPTQAFHKRSH